jgi:hypothetical protein
VQYRCRTEAGHFIERYGVKLDNGWVVPYNLALLKRFRAHINVEWCNKTHLIKYLFKYITKGPDRARVVIKPLELTFVIAIHKVRLLVEVLVPSR